MEYKRNKIKQFIEQDPEPNSYTRDSLHATEYVVTVIKHCKTGKFIHRLGKTRRGLGLLIWSLKRGQHVIDGLLDCFNLSPIFSILEIDVNSEKEAWEICYWIADHYRNCDKLILPRGSNFFFKKLPERLSDIIDGALAGDGGVYPHSGRSSIFVLSLSRAQLPHLEDFKKELETFGYGGKIRFQSQFNKDLGRLVDYCELSWTLIAFNETRKRWYPSGVKILPDDVRNTSDFWRWFYAGDGCLYHSSRSSSGIYIAANDFRTKDVDRLISMLSEHGIEATKYLKRYTESTGKPQWTISIRVGEATRKFLRMIGPPVRGLEYKWAARELIYSNCENCGKDYIQGRKDKRFCSVRCLQASGHKRRSLNRERRTLVKRKSKERFNRLRALRRNAT